MRRTSTYTFRKHPLLHVLLALTSVLIHLSTARSDLELIGPITTKSIDMTIVGVDASEKYRVWQTTTADFIMDYFKDSENVFDVQVECAMLFETITEIPIGTYTGNAGVPGSQWTMGGERRLTKSVRITYNQITSYKSDDPSVYDETYLVEEPFRRDAQKYIEKLKSSSEKGHYDPVVEVGVGIPPPTPPPTLKPKFVFPPTPKKKSGGDDSMLFIIIGVACGGALIILGAGIFIVRRRRKSRGPQNIMVGNNPQQFPHSIFTGSTPQTMGTGVESGNNSWNSGNMNNMQAVTGVPAAPPPMMMQDREEVLPSGEVRIHVVAPKGKLGVTVENLQWGGPSYVAKVSGKSPLFGRVQIGDKVMAIDGDDVQQVSAKDISKLLDRKKKNPQRQITFMRGESKGNNHQMQPNNSVPSGMNNMGNNMGNDPYSRQGSQMDNRGILPDHSNDSLFRSMNNMGNDPYGMGRGGSFRDDRHSNHALSRSMNYMENDPYRMGREGRQRDDRHFQRSHSISRIEDNGTYGMGRDDSHRDDRDLYLNQSAHGIRGEAIWREDRDLDFNRSAHGVRGEASRRGDDQFQRRRNITDVDNDTYGMGREGSRREHFPRNYSVSSGLTMDNDLYRGIREGRQREDRGLDFNRSAPGGMNMDSDPYRSGREGVRREDRDFDFNRSAPDDMDMDNDFYEREGRGGGRDFYYRRSALGDMNVDDELYGSGREAVRREGRDFHPRHSAPPLMESEIIDPYSHEGNNHFSDEPATQDADFAGSNYDVITAIAPKGKLGFVLEDSSDGPSFVSEIHEDSVLKGEIVLFDRISSIDGQDVKGLKSFHISKLLAHKSRNEERKIVFLRETHDGGQNKFMV